MHTSSKRHGTLAYGAALAALALATTAQAATYYWKGVTGDTGGGNWSDLSNWSTESADGADATAVPGASDKFYGLQSRSIDLEGQEWSIGGWDSTGNWTSYTMNLWNGTLNVVGNTMTHSDAIGIRAGAKLVFASGATFTPAVWDGGKHYQYVHDGGEVDILGNFSIYNYGLTVFGGGTALLNPTRWDISNNTAQKSYLQNDGGTLSLPGGISFNSGSTSGQFEFSIKQNSGTLILGGPISKNGKAGAYNATLSGGTIHVTGNVSFDLDSITISDDASITLDIDSGASIDLSGITYGSGSGITKVGAGDLPFVAGMALPPTMIVQDGALVLGASGTSYDLSDVTFLNSGVVKIGATGITLSGNSSLDTVPFIADIASPVAGSTLLTCTDPAVLANARTGLNATLPEGFAVEQVGDSLIVTSSYVFNSTTVTDINDPNGWSGGSVPVGKVVTIAGSGVNAIATSLPTFAGITVQDGALLTISCDANLPSTTLASGGSLTIASGTVTASESIAIQHSGATYSTITVASGATLNVPGGSIFTDCDLSVSGTLATTTSGDLILGYAAAGTSASFGLTVNGGTISTSAGDIRFFSPVAGGTVTPTGTIAFTDAAFTHDTSHGFQFGVNNPTTTAITFTFDGTQLNYPKTGNYYISGGAALRFINGGSLYRANSQNDNCLLYVTGLASIYLGPGTSSLFGESANGGSVGNGRIVFNPDADGHIALTLDNATWETYHSASGSSVAPASDTNGKAVAEIFGNSVHTINQNNWNRAQPFSGFKAVHLNDNAVLTISNGTDATPTNFSEKFTGTGSLVFTTSRVTSGTRTFNYNSTASTATGTLSTDPAMNTKLVIAPTATWAGTVLWNGKVEITHSASADSMTFGGIDLGVDFGVRLWADGSCDHYTLTGAGFVANSGNIVITIADGSEPEQGAEWTFARVPATSASPTLSSSAWTISRKAVDGDDSMFDLVISPVSSDFEFNDPEVTDLSSTSGWSCGYVPSGEIVKITGQGVVAIVSDASTFPAFASIAVRNGATLKVLDDVTLPPLTIDSISQVVIGDNATLPGVSATLDASLTTIADSTATPVALPIIEVATNATLTVANGMKFKNVDFRLYGTVSNDIAEASPVFGYAENGETSYFAMTADGGVFGFHSNQSGNNASVSILCPASGGTVIPVGTVVLRNASRPVNGWADFGRWEFGRNNPTNIGIDVFVDGTHIDAAAEFYASGATHMTLANDSRVQRQGSCLGHGFNMALQDAATIEIGEGCFVDFTTGDGRFGIDSQVTVDTVTVRNGGAYTVTHNSSGWGLGTFVANGGILGVGKAYNSRMAHSDLIQGFGSARLDGDLDIASVNIGTGDTDWDRHVKIANIPFTGTGDITVTNGVPAYPFSVTVQNGANTATGSIKVAKAAEDVETALYFGNGANWAGTVVAGNVGLTNVASAASAASASFATLDLAADFPIRVWRDNGAVATNDMVNVEAYVNHGGRLVPVIADAVTENEKLGAGARIVVGTIAKSSPNPALQASWGCKREDIAGDEDHQILTLFSTLGLQIILQ